MSPHRQHDPDRPDTETLEKMGFTKKSKGLNGKWIAIFTILAGGGLSLTWVVLGNMVDISRTPARVTAVESALNEERSTRQSQELVIGINQSNILVTLQDMKREIHNMYVRQNGTPKQKDENSQ